MQETPEISSAKGRLGVLLPGMGAVATTTIAGVILARKGLAKPIGSLTQMNTIRLGQRTEKRSPLIKDFIGNGIIRLCRITKKSCSRRKHHQVVQLGGVNDRKDRSQTINFGAIDGGKIFNGFLLNHLISQYASTMD